MLGRLVGSEDCEGETPFELRDDHVTQTLAILAKKRSGKSNTAVVMAEELWDRGHQWVAIDPKGDWFGIRSDGDEPGSALPIPVFGGLHGDLPLHEGAGAVMADLIVDRQLTCVLDVSRFPSKAAQARFLTDFAERIYERHAVVRRPIHLFLEEAEQYIPEASSGRDGMATCVGAWSKLVRLGGAFGIGCTLVTQRAAGLSKTVLTQIEILVVHRIRAQRDRESVIGWFGRGEAKVIEDTLRTLGPGEAWITDPDDDDAHRVQVRRRRTFDSGATPQVGVVLEPTARTRLSDADIEVLRETLAAEIETAEANDPAVLRRQIADLERQLAEGAPVAAAPVEPERVEVVPDWVKDAAASLSWLPELADDVANTIVELTQLERRLRGQTKTAERLAAMPAAAPAPAPAKARGKILFADPSAHIVDRAAPAGPAPAPSSGGGDLSPSARKVLAVLAHYPEGSTRERVGLLAGVKPTSSTLRAAMAELRREGLACEGTPLRATPAGIAIADVEPLPTGAELVAYWRERLTGAEQKALDVIVATWPQEATKDDLVAAGVAAAPTSSTIRAVLAKLRKLDLCEKGAIRAHDALFQEAS